MFFRREKPAVPTFDDRLSALAQYAMTFAKKGSGKAAVMRRGCAAILEDGGDHVKIGATGIIVGREIGELTDGGYQKFFLTPTGHKEPALASHLKELHSFTEDLREALGINSLYNESLGTTNEKHMYDRVRGRDPQPKH